MEPASGDILPTGAHPVARWCRETPRAIAVIENDVSYSYSMLAMNIVQTAKILAAAGLRQGMIVGIECHVQYLHLVLILACEILGATHAALLDDDVAGDSELVARCDFLCTETRNDHVSKCPRVLQLSREFVQEMLAVGVQGDDLALLERGYPATDLVRIGRTSGTTGRPKFVGYARRSLKNIVDILPYMLKFDDIPRLPKIPKKPLAKRSDRDSTGRMIRAGFLDSESRRDLTELAQDGSAAHRLARRANALVLLDGGMSCEAIAKVLLVDDDSIRTWYRLYEEDGIEGLASFGYEGGACRLSVEQQDKLKAWVTETLPRTTREVGAWIEKDCGIGYQGRSGLIALLHRLGMEHRKPKAVSRKLDPEKQAAFIKKYEDLLNHLDADEAVLFADAVHPTHAVRPVGCWAPKDTPIAVPQTSGRQRLNIHGAIDLETGKTRMLEVATVDAISTIMLLMAIEAMYPGKRLIHLFLDNARYHHAKLVQAWLAKPGCRIKLHFVPAYCPHLDSIERLWGLMHKHITHNRCYEKFADFSDAILTFLREEVPRNWHIYCDEVSDNFRIISPKDFRILA